jgi:hypothetical protein
MKLAPIGALLIGLGAGCGSDGGSAISSASAAAQVIGELTALAYESLLSNFTNNASNGTISGACDKGGMITVVKMADPAGRHATTLAQCSSGRDRFDGSLNVSIDIAGGAYTLRYSGTVTSSGAVDSTLDFDDFTEVIVFDSGQDSHSFTMTLTGTVTTRDAGGAHSWSFTNQPFHYESGNGQVACDPTCTSGSSVEVVPSPGPTVPDDFLGISVEWDNVPSYLGDGAGGARAATVTLLSAFAEEGHRPVVRIGGNSEDQAWWNPSGATPPAGVHIDVDASYLSTLAALQSALGNQLVLGLDLALDDATNAAALVTAAQAAIAPGGVMAFELGNEPDSYVPTHRPSSYDWPTYITEVDAFRDGIAQIVTPAPPFQWPALAGQSWLGNLDQQLAAEAGRFAVVSTHVYPFTVCNALPPPAPADLLSDHATVAVGTLYAPHAQAAHALSFPFRMGEMNSVSCGGAPGVSDVFAAALWGADICMQLAGAGLDGVNFHGGAAPGGVSYYGLFVFDADGTPRVRPLYYGLRLFSLATASHGRLLPVKVTTSARIHAFATLGEDGVTRVLLLGLSSTGPDHVQLRLTGARTATLVRLGAPALDATSGLSLGGLTWDGSSDGKPMGSAASETLRQSGDAWDVPLSGYEAVLVTAQ